MGGGQGAATAYAGFPPGKHWFCRHRLIAGEGTGLWSVGILQSSSSKGHKKKGQMCPLMNVETMDGVHETESITLHQGLWSPWTVDHVLLET